MFGFIRWCNPDSSKAKIDFAGTFGTSSVTHTLCEAPRLCGEWIFKCSDVKHEEVMSLVYLHFTLILPLSSSFTLLSLICETPEQYLHNTIWSLSQSVSVSKWSVISVKKLQPLLSQMSSFPLFLTVIRGDWRRVFPHTPPRCCWVFIISRTGLIFKLRWDRDVLFVYWLRLICWWCSICSRWYSTL